MKSERYEKIEIKNTALQTFDSSMPLFGADNWSE